MDVVTDLWPRIEAGRRALGDYLAQLTDDEWARPTWCAGWTVKDVAAHMLVVPTLSKGTVFRSFVRAGFNLDKMNATFVRRIAASKSGAEIAALTASSAASRTMPPGLKVKGVLTELVVHASDIVAGVGRPFALPVEDQVVVLEHLRNVEPVFHAKTRAAGLTLRATDTDWSAGSGPLVEGPAHSLVSALAGRPAACDGLTGDGVATMRTR